MLENSKIRSAQLYRQFSKTGELLYVGVSLSALVRLSQHKDNSHWFSDIGKVEIQNFPSRESAISAETAAIKNEKPKWNVQHKKSIEKPEPRISIAKNELIYSVVTLQPIYDFREAAGVLHIGTGALTRLIQNGKIGFIELPPFREGGKLRIRITGWQLLDYIESLGGLIPGRTPGRAHG
jgi:hypothetical protein